MSQVKIEEEIARIKNNPLKPHQIQKSFGETNENMKDKFTLSTQEAFNQMIQETHNMARSLFSRANFQREFIRHTHAPAIHIHNDILYKSMMDAKFGQIYRQVVPVDAFKLTSHWIEKSCIDLQNAIRYDWEHDTYIYDSRKIISSLNTAINSYWKDNKLTISYSYTGSDPEKYLGLLYQTDCLIADEPKHERWQQTEAKLSEFSIVNSGSSISGPVETPDSSINRLN